MIAATPSQARVVLTLARVYVGLGRARRGVALAEIAAEARPACVETRRTLLRGYLALGRHREVLVQIDALLEHEFDSGELAFALGMQSRALHALGRSEQARDAWRQFGELCAIARLDPEAMLA